MPPLSPDRESRRFWDDISKTCLPISAGIIKQTFWDRVVWIIFLVCFLLKVAPELGRLLSTYQLIPSFKECAELHCFADDVEKAKLLPPPVPPTTKKHEIFDINKYRKVDERAVKVWYAFFELVHLIERWFFDIITSYIII